MTIVSSIYKRGVKYRYYETYGSYAKARQIALYFKKKLKSKYIIVKTERDYWFPLSDYNYRLYLTKIWRKEG